MKLFTLIFFLSFLNLTNVPNLFGECKYLKSIPEPPQVTNIQSCLPGSFILEASSNNYVGFRWYFEKDGEAIPGETKYLYETPFIEQTTDFYVSAFNETGESERVSVTVTIYSDEEIDAGEDLTIRLGETVQLMGNGGIKYNWKPDDGLNFSNIPNPVASPKKTTTYILEVQTAVGCIFRDSVTIKVLNESLLPMNVFTPNNDGINDEWIIVNDELFSEIKVSILDKWGTEVYASQGYTQPWDGTFQGRKVSPGTYFYVIDSDDLSKIITGILTVIY